MPMQRTCPQCGEPIEPGDRFCAGCGWTVRAGPKEERATGLAPAQVRSPPRRKILVTLAVLAVLLVAAGSVLRMWGGSEAERLMTERPTALVFTTEENRIAAGYLDGKIRLYNTASGAPEGMLQGSSAEVGALGITLDGQRLVSLSTDGNVTWWDLRMLSSLGALKLPVQLPFRHAAFLPGSTRLALMDQDTAVLYDLDSQTVVWSFNSGSKRVLAVSWDSRLIAVCGNRAEIEVFDGKNRAVVASFPPQHMDDAPDVVVFHPAGLHLAVQTVQGRLHLLDMRTGARQDLGERFSLVGGFAFSQSGEMLAASGGSSGLDWKVALWDGRDGKPLRTLVAPPWFAPMLKKIGL